MKRWEKIKEAIDNPSRTIRAKYMFELMEEERKSSVDTFKEHTLSGIIKNAIIEHDRITKYKASKKRAKIEKFEDEE